MIEAEFLFHGYSKEGRHNNRHHMHEMVCLLGEPPLEFLQRSPHTWRLFSENGMVPLVKNRYAQLALLTMGSRGMEGRAARDCPAVRSSAATAQRREPRGIFGFHEMFASLATRKKMDRASTSPTQLA